MAPASLWGRAPEWPMTCPSCDTIGAARGAAAWVGARAARDRPAARPQRAPYLVIYQTSQDTWRRRVSREDCP